MKEQGIGQGPEGLDRTSSRHRRWRWTLGVLIMTLTYVVSVLLQVNDGMSVQEAGGRSAIPVVLVSVALFVIARRRIDRGP
jgi:hypothetical protein